MIVAITYENEMVFQHFGHCAQFMLYHIEYGVVVKKELLPCNGVGHGALATLLKQNGVNTLICGGIGGGAKQALANASIQVFPGVNGKVEDAINAFLKGSLQFNPNTHCDHHDHENHSCGNHGCH